MDKRLSFNEDAKNYDTWRPTYCKELFEDIFKYASLTNDKNVLEVGIGTGQATTPFLKAGCNVTAVELGANLAEFSRDKFKQYNNFKVYNTSFEEFECEDSTIDILYSATAFHWIPVNIGYPKALRLLKDNGTLALFWNRPAPAKEDYSLHLQIQKIYEKYSHVFSPKTEDTIERRNRISHIIKENGFRDFELKLYHRSRSFTGEEYINLLDTYSDHRSLPQDAKEAFQKEIKDTIIKNGNMFNLHDTIELYLARK